MFINPLTWLVNDSLVPSLSLSYLKFGLPQRFRWLFGWLPQLWLAVLYSSNDPHVTNLDFAQELPQVWCCGF
jgi:hypothetical protein